MTSAEAIQQAKDSMSDADLRRFRLSRAEWENNIDWLADFYGIYPDNDPRNERCFSDSQ